MERKIEVDHEVRGWLRSDHGPIASREIGKVKLYDTEDVEAFLQWVLLGVIFVIPALLIIESIVFKQLFGTDLSPLALAITFPLGCVGFPWLMTTMGRDGINSYCRKITAKYGSSSDTQRKREYLESLQGMKSRIATLKRVFNDCQDDETSRDLKEQGKELKRLQDKILALYRREKETEEKHECLHEAESVRRTIVSS